MKKILLAVLLIFAFCSMGAAEMENSPDGFRGIKWGDPPSKLGAREETYKDEISSLYTKTGDEMVVGSVKLESIEYEFLQDRQLMAVFINTKGYSNSERLRDVMIALYGEPVEIDSDYYLWHDDSVLLAYRLDLSTATSIAALMSKPLLDKEDEIKKELAEQGAKDY